MGIELKSLTCNYMDEPVSLKTPTPGFSWIISSEGRGVKQKSYRIIVATTAGSIKKGFGDMWDTGWVESDKSVNVRYEGKALQSDTTYYWSAAITDTKGNSSEWAAPHGFTTAFFKQTDWHSSFIGVKEVPVEGWPGIFDGSVRASMFRCEYTLLHDIKKARAFFSGLGWGELYINGGRVGDSVLDPGPTDYRFSVPYVVYDVTGLLKKGSNALGIMAGNGWFSEYKWKFAYGLTPKAMLQINVEYSDGTKEILCTNKQWKTAYGPILENRMWGGEYYDAREEQDGWTLPGFDDSNWEGVKIKDRCQGLMKAQEMPPVRVMDTVSPVELQTAAYTVTDSSLCIRVFDMRKLFGGWSRISVKGEAGQKITIKYSDRMDEKGYVDQSFQKPFLAMEPKPCTDTYVLKGEPAGESYEPRFTFHPVQYVQVEYDPLKAELISLEGRHTYQGLDFTGEFCCSNELFNKIHAAVVQTVKNQTLGIPLDCLNREHWGWVDPASIAGTFYPRQHIPLFWRKWIEDIRESQFANGAIPDTAPLYIQNWHNPDPIWGGSFVRLVWFYYQYYNDDSILRENYDSLKRLFEYHSLHKRNGILTEGTYGDHMIPGEAPGKEIFISSETSYEYLWTGWYFESAHTLSRIAKIVGSREEEEHYAALAEETRKVINDVWFNKEEAIYDKGSQTAQYYALAAGFVPEEEKERVLDRAIKDLMGKYNGNHHTGNTGTTAMLDSLGDCGHADILYKMLNRTSYPGWGYMIDHGATTIWESWSTENAVGCELSMTMYTTVDEFFYNELAGIKGPGYFGDSLFGRQGFQSAVLAPYIPEDMEFARANIRTVYGRLASGWVKRDGKTFFDISLPGNTDAVVQLPFASGCTVLENAVPVWSNGKYIPGVQGIENACIQDGKITFMVGSGDYRFEVECHV